MQSSRCANLYIGSLFPVLGLIFLCIRSLLTLCASLSATRSGSSTAPRSSWSAPETNSTPTGTPSTLRHTASNGMQACILLLIMCPLYNAGGAAMATLQACILLLIIMCPVCNAGGAAMAAQQAQRMQLARQSAVGVPSNAAPETPKVCVLLHICHACILLLICAL